MSISGKDVEMSEISNIMHVHDLPQLYTRPTTDALLDTLRLLKQTTTTFDINPTGCNEEPATCLVDPSGVPRYLTGIISSSLKWLADNDRERIWDLASLRLSERSGRSAAPSMTRSFKINSDLVLKLHEPSLTEDSLGLKTWTSSLLLSKRLPSLAHHVPAGRPRLLELGSGTGLVGLAASRLWKDLLSEVVLTDLPEIVPNLQKNIDQNIINDAKVTCKSRVLDWADVSDAPADGDPRFSIIVAADPIYSTDHPAILVDTVHRWIAQSSSSRFIVELPLREHYKRERDDLRDRLSVFMQIIEDGEEVGIDDWHGRDGQPAEVKCWWSVWKLKDKS